VGGLSVRRKHKNIKKTREKKLRTRDKKKQIKTPTKSEQKDFGKEGRFDLGDLGDQSSEYPCSNVK